MNDIPFGGKACTRTDYKSAKIIVFPIPYDDTATWQKGAALGPEAIMEASAHVELYDIETDSEVHVQGIHTFQLPHLPGSPEGLARIMRQNVASFIKDGKFPVLLGGNHSITPGAVQGIKDYFSDKNIKSVLTGEGDLNELGQKISKTISYKAPLAIKIANTIIDEGSKLNLNEGLEVELSHLSEIFSSEDALEGLNSVIKRQRPSFKGK